MRSATAGYQRLFGRWQELKRPRPINPRLALRQPAGQAVDAERGGTHDSIDDVPPMMSRPRNAAPARAPRLCRGVSCAATADTAVGQPAADGAVFVQLRVRAGHADRSPLPARFLYAHRDAITGDVLEVQTDSYTKRFGHGVRRADTLRHRARLSADIPVRLRALRDADSRARLTTACCCPTRCQHFRELDSLLGQARRIVRPRRRDPGVGGGTAAADRRYARILAADAGRLARAAGLGLARRGRAGQRPRQLSRRCRRATWSGGRRVDGRRTGRTRRPLSTAHDDRLPEAFMKVLILCGGYGSRLGAAGGDLPKPMVAVGGKPIV